MKRHLPLFILFVLLCVIGVWSWTAQPWKDWMHRGQDENTVVLDRYDRVLDEYVSLGSYTALHRMNTQYPMQTKLLIEDVLKLGVVNEPDVEQRLRHYYLDSTVQVLLDEVHRQYNDMSDIEADLNRAFEELRKEDPSIKTPHIYTQVSCLNQSIIVSDTLIGISLDKYLGEDFPLYAEYYTAEQRAQMTRDAIVRDAINAYQQYSR
ncbi:MAG: gliding motility protein GldB [Bacteroidaceae bacterium]|nr:gliding motility protein GldB [Bacteroidaceae bacterium]